MTEPQADETELDDAHRLIPSGEKLTAAQAALVPGRLRVVAIAAPPASGKTTLLAGIYEQFCRGPFAGFTFAGSRTLVGFERTLFHASNASGRARPSIAHTEYADNVLLHLALAPQAHPGEVIETVMLDASGELFSTFVDHDELGPARDIVRYADKVLLVVDGERLADPRTRQRQIAESRFLLRALTERVLRRSTTTLAVITKWDLIRRLPKAEEIQTAVQRNLSGANPDTAVRVVGDLPLFVARPVAGPSEPDGLADLVRWMVSTSARPYTASAAVPVGSRPADRFRAPGRVRRPAGGRR